MKKLTPQIKIYRDGKLSYTETYRPVIKQKIVKLGNSIDYFFVNHEWPKQNA